MRVLCWRADPGQGGAALWSSPRGRQHGGFPDTARQPTEDIQDQRGSPPPHVHPATGSGCFHPLAQQGKIVWHVAIMERAQLNLDPISVPGDPSSKLEEREQPMPGGMSIVGREIGIPH
jgi:hypothetical protein